MRKLLSVLMGVLLTLLPLAGTPVMAQGQNPPSNQSFVAGRFIARDYNYPGIRINGGGGSAGSSYSIQLSQGSVRLADGRTIVPFSAGGVNILGQPGPFPAIRITVGAGTTLETVTPTAVSGCYVGAPQNSCTITATFTNAHGQGELVTSGTDGIQEALNDAGFYGGGLVVVDSSLNLLQGGAATVTADMVAATPVINTAIEDIRGSAPSYWNVNAGTTAIATPATLTNSTAGFGVAGANFTSGSYTGSSSYIACIAYVDIMGQEGPCSATFTLATSGVASTDQVGFTAPAASSGAVGYTIYISLASGSYNLAYKVPLVSQPSVVGAYPASSGVCTLTTVETTTPACALTNSTYGQTGSTAIVSALTLNTSPITPQATVISTTSVYVPNAGGRTTYIYAPSAQAGIANMPSTWTPFTIGAAANTVVPAVEGTINLPPNFMNTVGKKIEICGDMTTTASAATIVDVQFQWDAVGQNTAGKGVLIGDMTTTPSSAIATAGHATFCQDFITTVASASATGGTINHVNSFGSVAGLTTVGAGALGDCMPGANAAGTGSLNLAVDARINIIYLHTTGTDGAGWTLQNLTLKQM